MSPAEPTRQIVWRRLLLAGRPRATRANALAAILAIALGFAIATQVHQTQGTGLEGMRQDDLLRVLDDVTLRSERLDASINSLTAQRDALQNTSGSSAAAQAQAQSRLDALRVLTGQVPAGGPGIELTISDPKNAYPSAALLDAVQELRDAGAEVIQVGDTRVVASTWFGGRAGALTADGKPIPAPVVIRAIGDPQTLASAMQIPGGVIETARRVGGTAAVRTLTQLTISVLAEPPATNYLQPG